jgi:hypothetical protein
MYWSSGRIKSSAKAPFLFKIEDSCKALSIEFGLVEMPLRTFIGVCWLKSVNSDCEPSKIVCGFRFCWVELAWAELV